MFYKTCGIHRHVCIYMRLTDFVRTSTCVHMETSSAIVHTTIVK